MTPEEAAKWKAKCISRGKLMDRFRTNVQEIVDHAENEIDRVYLGSTNHLEWLKDMALEMERWNWDAIIREREEVDPYQAMRELRGQNEALRKALQDERQRCADIARNASGSEEAYRQIMGEDE